MVIDFTLPAELEAHDPPEARGLARDGVRMLVSRRSSGEIGQHAWALVSGVVLMIFTRLSVLTGRSDWTLKVMSSRATFCGSTRTFSTRPTLGPPEYRTVMPGSIHPAKLK